MQLLQRRDQIADGQGGTTSAISVVVFSLLALLPVFTLFTLPRALAAGGVIAVSPAVGPIGQVVTVTGTSWQELGSRGIDVPITIGFANQVADGHPDANGNFTVSFNVPVSLPSAPDFVGGKLTISAIIGNGSSADAIYTVISSVDCDNIFLSACMAVLKGQNL